MLKNFLREVLLYAKGWHDFVCSSPLCSHSLCTFGAPSQIFRQLSLPLPLSASLCSASCLFNCAPMSINLLRVKQTPPSSPLPLSLPLYCPIWKRCWRLLSPNPLSGGINIALVHPLCKCAVTTLQCKFVTERWPQALSWQLRPF